MSLADCTPALCSNTGVEGAAVLVACRCATTLGRFCSGFGAWLASRAFLAGHLIKHEVRWRKLLRQQTSPLHEGVACGEQAASDGLHTHPVYFARFPWGPGSLFHCSIARSQKVMGCIMHWLLQSLYTRKTFNAHVFATNVAGLRFLAHLAGNQEETSPMYESDKDAADEHWYGVQEAASYLGIHRATLFRALRSGLIIADRTTPKGRARFRLASLMAFRDQLRHQAATSQEHAYAPVAVLAKLAGLGRSPDPVEHSIAVMEDAVRLLCSSGGNYDMALVALNVPSESDPYALKTLAQCGLPESLKASYTYLRPDVPFPVNVVSRTGEAEICEDISVQMTPRVTAQRVLAQSSISSYAVYPIVSGSDDAGAILGVLAVC